MKSKKQDIKEKEGGHTRTLTSHARNSQKYHYCGKSGTVVTNWLLIKRMKRNLTSKARETSDYGTRK